MDLKERVASYFWFHSIDLGNGVVTPGRKSLAVHRKESAAFFDSVDLTGRSVLDIGAWNGAYSFDVKRRGAARVLATDSYTWNVRAGRETIELARDALGLDIELLEVDVPEITPQRVGEFDVVLFLGVFYHLLDPIDGLAKAASVARELLIVETALDLLDLEQPAMAFYPGRELNNDATNWWGPNPACVKALLAGHGFTTIDAQWNGNGRGIFHAWRSEKARRGPPSGPALVRPPAQSEPVQPPSSKSLSQALRSGFRRARRGARGGSGGDGL